MLWRLALVVAIVVIAWFGYRQVANAICYPDSSGNCYLTRF